MTYAIYKGEKNLKDLVSRLFTLPDKSAKTAKQAQDALVQANPQLKDLASVPAGSMISIPTDAPPLNATERAPAKISRQAEVARQAQDSLFRLSEKLQTVNSIAVPLYQTFLTALESNQPQIVAQKSPDLKDQLPALLKSAQALGKAVQTQQSTDILAPFRAKPGS